MYDISIHGVGIVYRRLRLPCRREDNSRIGGQTGFNLLYVDLVLAEEVKDDTEDTKKIKS